jgi:hypothetical protein
MVNQLIKNQTSNLNPIAMKVFNVKVKSTPIGMCDMSLQGYF